MLEITGGSMSTVYETSHADFPAVYAVRASIGRLQGICFSLISMIHMVVAAHVRLTFTSAWRCSRPALC